VGAEIHQTNGVAELQQMLGVKVEIPVEYRTTKKAAGTNGRTKYQIKRATQAAG
jgi:hypothetical protein